MSRTVSHLGLERDPRTARASCYGRRGCGWHAEHQLGEERGRGCAGRRDQLSRAARRDESPRLMSVVSGALVLSTCAVVGGHKHIKQLLEIQVGKCSALRGGYNVQQWRVPVLSETKARPSAPNANSTGYPFGESVRHAFRTFKRASCAGREQTSVHVSVPWHQGSGR